MTQSPNNKLNHLIDIKYNTLNIKGNYDCEQDNDGSLRKSLTDRAHGYLVRREHSAWELFRKLKDHGPFAVVEQVIRQLQDRGEQSDTRFAEMLCRSRFNRGKGPVKLLHELKEHRIDSEIISAAMSEYEDRWTELAKLVRSKKFGDDLPGSLQEWSRQARFLQQRGFSTSHFGRYEE